MEGYKPLFRWIFSPGWCTSACGVPGFGVENQPEDAAGWGEEQEPGFSDAFCTIFQRTTPSPSRASSLRSDVSAPRLFPSQQKCSGAKFFWLKSVCAGGGSCRPLWEREISPSSCGERALPSPPTHPLRGQLYLQDLLKQPDLYLSPPDKAWRAGGSATPRAWTEVANGEGSGPRAASGVGGGTLCFFNYLSNS